jgi:DNA-binding SARP family transcriptional activator/class 3 adenylate cyclase
VEFAVLGSFTVWKDGRALDLGAPKQRSVLVLLLLRANQLVPTAVLVDELWGDRPPQRAVKAVQVYVGQLRKALGKGVIETLPTGYLLRLEDSALDAQRFEDHLGQGRRLLAEGATEDARRMLREGLALWRGPALAEFRFESFARNEISRLEELRLVALEHRLEADLALGRGPEVIGELEGLLSAHPLRESLCRLLILALYRAGRQGDALAVYHDARARLDDELGLEPGQVLQQLEKAILLQDPSLNLPAPATALVEAPPNRPVVPERECTSCGASNPHDSAYCRSCAAPLSVDIGVDTRKVVTILFTRVVADAQPDEQVDPESTRFLTSHYFEIASAAVERHGGTVDRLAGDRVVGVFGVPAVHEDDALRAARAALEIRDALSDLGMRARFGISTGEVLAGSPVVGSRLVTGDPVTIGEQFEEAAAAGEVLIDGLTLALLADAAEFDPLEPLRPNDKIEPVSVYRLLRVREAGPKRPHEMRFVGRKRELALVSEILERVRAERHCELVTIVGDAGLGKSRLVAELTRSVDASVVRGRCLSYGEGITYWPVVQVLKELGLSPADEDVAAAIRSLLGETETTTSAEEIAWAFRKVLEQAAAERPVVVVFDDLQWGEETFLDLVEHIAFLSSGAAIILLCMARPQLLDRRPSFPLAVRLTPLSDDEVEELIPARIAGELRAKIAQAAGGNPLYIREMLVIADEEEDDIVVPPTLRAVLQARLDRLEPRERSVLEAGSVEGRIFHHDFVQEMAPSDTAVTPILAALVRKDLIIPRRTELDLDGFRFRHLLIRDAAYDALPKATRAGLHERYAGWLEDHRGNLSSLDEVVGYHLEQSIRYRAELGLPDVPLLIETARRRLTVAGDRALDRLDYHAAVGLLERAASLVPADELDRLLEIDLGDALLQAGDGGEALRRAGSLAERASAAGDQVAVRCARIQEATIHRLLEPEDATDRLAALVEEALPVFEAAGDDLALSIAYMALGEVSHQRAQFDTQLDAYERAVVHARRAGRPHELEELRALARWYGTTPVPRLLGWLDEKDAQGARDPVLDGYRAGALAMLGRFDEARAILGEVRAALTSRGGGMSLAFANSHLSTCVEMLAGDSAAATAFGEEGCRRFEEMGEKGYQSTAAGILAQALYAHERLDEAVLWAERAEELAASDDTLTRMLSLQARAKVFARRSESAEAERLAREAVALAQHTECPTAQGDALADLAEVLQLSGQSDEAIPVLEEARALYERKGNLVMAGRLRARLAVA